MHMATMQQQQEDVCANQLESLRKALVGALKIIVCCLLAKEDIAISTKNESLLSLVHEMQHTQVSRW